VKELEIFYEDIQPLKLQNKHIKECINTLIVSELKHFGEISIILCSDKYLLDVNVKYLNHNYFTDIITFNYVEGNTVSGDLFISIDRVKENALEYSVTWIKELYRVILHGILHLVGYNDKSDSEQKIMREKEDYYLKTVDFSKIKE
jgi:rRNA maturation RNase YbeY